MAQSYVSSVLNPVTADQLRAAIGLATDEQEGLSPALTLQSTDYLSGAGDYRSLAGITGGGFQPQIDSSGTPITIDGALSGIHKQLDVAAAITLAANAPVLTRAMVTPASTGTTSVAVAGGAVYRLPPADDPGDPGRTAGFVLIEPTEFECIRNSGGNAAEWNIYGRPAGTTTRLAGPLDLAAQQIIPGAPVVKTGAYSYVAEDSGKCFRIDTPGGTQTIPAGLPSGWEVTILNNLGSSITIDGPGSTNVTLTAGQVCTVKYWSSTTIKVAAGNTTGIN